MSERQKQILAKIEEAIKSGKMDDISLGTIYGIAITSTAGAAVCQQ